MHIGTDIIEIVRIQKAMQNPRFLKKYFTPAEISLITAKQEKAAAATAAANFCGKEAVVKAIGTGFGKIQLIDIEILRNTLGSPYVNLYGEAKKSVHADLAGTDIKISLSHSKDYAIAMVIINDARLF